MQQRKEKRLDYNGAPILEPRILETEEQEAAKEELPAEHVEPYAQFVIQ